MVNPIIHYPPIEVYERYTPFARGWCKIAQFFRGNVIFQPLIWQGCHANCIYSSLELHYLIYTYYSVIICWSVNVTVSSYSEVNGHKLGIRIQPNPRSSCRWQAFLGGGSPCRGIVPAVQIPSTVRSQWRRYNPSCNHVFPSFACITFTLWWWWFHDQLSLLFFIIISVYRLTSHSLSLLTFVCHYWDTIFFVICSWSLFHALYHYHCLIADHPRSGVKHAQALATPPASRKARLNWSMLPELSATSASDLEDCQGLGGQCLEPWRSAGKCCVWCVCV